MRGRGSSSLVGNASIVFLLLLVVYRFSWWYNLNSEALTKPLQMEMELPSWQWQWKRTEWNSPILTRFCFFFVRVFSPKTKYLYLHASIHTALSWNIEAETKFICGDKDDVKEWNEKEIEKRKTKKPKEDGIRLHGHKLWLLVSKKLVFTQNLCAARKIKLKILYSESMSIRFVIAVTRLELRPTREKKTNKCVFLYKYYRFI